MIQILCLTDMLPPIFSIGPNFLPRIKNVKRVKNLFGFFKKPNDFRRIHERKIGSANKSVIMFSGNTAFKTYYELMHFVGKFFYDFDCFRFVKIHQWNNMKITVTDMP